MKIVLAIFLAYLSVTSAQFITDGACLKRPNEKNFDVQKVRIFVQT
jgi:hypothetical protein